MLTAALCSWYSSDRAFIFLTEVDNIKQLWSVSKGLILWHTCTLHSYSSKKQLKRSVWCVHTRFNYESELNAFSVLICTEQFDSHTCWLKWLSIPNLLCEHSQTHSFLPRCKFVSRYLSVRLSHNQIYKQKRYSKSWIQRLQWVTCLEKSTKALFLIQSLGRYCSTFLLRPAKKQEVKLHTTPIWDNHQYLPCYHVKSACHFNVLMLILICPSPIKCFRVH